jgi:hypothetical protein
MKSHYNPRSDFDAASLHLAIWRKKGMQEPDFTAKTKAGSIKAQKAIYTFFEGIGEIAEHILPFIKPICPKLIILLCQYMFIKFPCFQCSTPIELGTAFKHCIQPALQFL